jgi:hypothetical protein
MEKSSNSEAIFKFDTSSVTGYVSVTATEVTIHKGKTFGRKTEVIDRARIARIMIGDPHSQYLTGTRAVGVIATGGIALLSPARKRVPLVIVEVSGEVHEFQLVRSEVKHVLASRARLTALGY